MVACAVCEASSRAVATAVREKAEGGMFEGLGDWCKLLRTLRSFKAEAMLIILFHFVCRMFRTMFL